jgi:hypothetical protein
MRDGWILLFAINGRFPFRLRSDTLRVTTPPMLANRWVEFQAAHGFSRRQPRDPGRRTFLDSFARSRDRREEISLKFPSSEAGMAQTRVTPPYPSSVGNALRGVPWRTPGAAFPAPGTPRRAFPTGPWGNRRSATRAVDELNHAPKQREDSVIMPCRPSSYRFVAGTGEVRKRLWTHLPNPEPPNKTLDSGFLLR